MTLVRRFLKTHCPDIINDHSQVSGSTGGDEVGLGKMLKVIRFLVGHLAHLVKV